MGEALRARKYLHGVFVELHEVFDGAPSVDIGVTFEARPCLVRLELAEPGVDADIEELQRVGVQAVSASGVLGDPTGASGGEGDQFITTFVNDLVHAVEAWRPIDPTPIG